MKTKKTYEEGLIEGYKKGQQATIKDNRKSKKMIKQIKESIKK